LMNADISRATRLPRLIRLERAEWCTRSALSKRRERPTSHSGNAALGDVPGVIPSVLAKRPSRRIEPVRVQTYFSWPTRGQPSSQTMVEIWSAGRPVVAS